MDPSRVFPPLFDYAAALQREIEGLPTRLSAGIALRDPIVPVRDCAFGARYAQSAQ